MTEIESTNAGAEGVERAYYPELDGLRFFAFLAVFVFHNGVPQFSGWINAAARSVARLSPGMKPPMDLGYRIQQNGWTGVQFFFILSGYLITTLLLREEGRYGRISLGAFWVRRALRIQPLYFLVVMLTFFVLPGIDGAISSQTYHSFIQSHLVPFLLYLGNWSMGLVGPVPYDTVSILWSVCVEEQFYLLLPCVLVVTPKRARIWIVLIFMAASISCRYLMARADVYGLLFQFATTTHVDTLFSGVLLALLLDRHPPGKISRRLAQIVQPALLLALVFVLSRPGLAHGTVERKTWDFAFLWLLGAGLIATLVVRPGILRTVLGYSRLVWLGKISYGLYMYHEIALWLARKVFVAVGWIPNGEILKTILGFALTAVFASKSALDARGIEAGLTCQRRLVLPRPVPSWPSSRPCRARAPLAPPRSSFATVLACKSRSPPKGSRSPSRSAVVSSVFSDPKFAWSSRGGCRETNGLSGEKARFARRRALNSPPPGGPWKTA